MIRVRAHAKSPNEYRLSTRIAWGHSIDHSEFSRDIVQQEASFSLSHGGTNGFRSSVPPSAPLPHMSWGCRSPRSASTPKSLQQRMQLGEDLFAGVTETWHTTRLSARPAHRIWTRLRGRGHNSREFTHSAVQGLFSPQSSRGCRRFR